MYRIWFFDIGNDWGFSVDIPALPGTDDPETATPMTEEELKQFVNAQCAAFGANAVRLEKDGIPVEL